MTDDPLLIGGPASPPPPPVPVPPLAPRVFVGPKTPPPPPAPPPEGLPRIRTYAADLSEEMRERGTTLTSIVSAEQARHAAPKEDPAVATNRRRTLILGALALCLIIIGAASVSAALFFRKKSQPTVITSSIIFPNRTVSVDVAAGPLAASLIALRENENPSLGEVERINVTAGGAPLSAQALATALGAPEPLVREVTDAMIGIHSFDRNQPFVIFEIAAYDRAFSATLAWEPSMGRALGMLFAPVGAKGNIPTLAFNDALIQNLDVRRSQAAWPVLYAFPSQHLLILTTNEYTLREVLVRLGTAP